MNSSLHAHHRNFSNISEDKTSLMSRNSRYREALDVVVIQCVYHADIIRIISQPGSQHECHLRGKIDLCLITFIAFL